MDENRIFRPLKHPLQNADIMEQVFKNLSLRDLLSSRQVCRVWLEGSAAAMRSCAHVQIDCRKNASAMSQFLEVAEATRRIFSKAPDVSRYTISDLQTYDDSFWTLCGKIKSLRLERITFPSADAFRHAIFQSCPKLEELHFMDVNVDGELAQTPLEWVPPQFPPNENLKHLTFEVISRMNISWMEIFSHFPSLKDLMASSVYSKDDALFRSLGIARQHNPQCWELKRFQINFSALKNTREIAELLVRENFSLEFLGLVGFSNSDSDSIQMILSNQTANLRKLALETRTPQQTIFPLPNNPLFEKLTDLSLRGSALQSTRFLRSMPNLRRLKLSHVEPGFGFDETEEDPWALDSCTDLELDLKTFRITDLRCLQKRLPNVEKLILRFCNNEMFSVVCEYWIKIASLKLFACDIDDSDISGLDVEDIKRMYEDLNCRPITVRRANLSSLKNLKLFSVYNYTDEIYMWTLKRLFNEKILQDNWSLSGHTWLWKLRN